MKYILLFSLISFSLLAQNMDNPPKKQDANVEDDEEMTQSKIREKRKLEIGGGMYGLAKKIPFVRLGYNITSRLTVGYTHFHQKKESNEPMLWYPIQNVSFDFSGITNNNPNAPSIYSTTEKNNSMELGLLHLRYYFWEKLPFYATGGIGRDFVGSQTTTKLHGDIYSSGSFVANPSYVWASDTSPHYLYFIGLGFQWVFEKGFFIGFENMRLQSINQRTNNYTINYQATFTQNVFQSFVDKGLSRKTHSTFQMSNFFIGYSFSM